MFFRRWRRRNTELDEEIEAHLRMAAQDRTGQGDTPDEARHAARREFGNQTLVKEATRQMWGGIWLERMGQDLRYALRMLRRAPGFALVVVLTLALGIGANTAIFTMLNAMMLRSLPVQDPRKLVDVGLNDQAYLTNPLWEAIRDHQQAFSGAFAWSPDQFDLSDGGESQFARGIWVSGDFFNTLGVPAIRGRVLTRNDDRRGGGTSGPVAVISYAFWKGHLGGDPDVVGKTIRLNRHAFVIAGVTPPWFRGLDPDHTYDVAIPLGCEPILHTDRSALDARSWWWLMLVGRLRPSETMPQAEARMKSMAPQTLRDTVPLEWPAEDKKQYLAKTLTLKSAATGFSGTAQQYRTALFTLMAVVGLVLLIACANVANLLLARAAARQREMSVRLAIGAGRGRVVQQLLTESLLLSLLGAVAGLLFAAWGSRLLVRLLSTTRNELQLDVMPDVHVLAFTIGVAVLTGILFGLSPAFRAAHVEPNSTLRETARGAVTGGSRFTASKALITGQVALSLMLLAGAGLFLGTLRNLLTVDPGFQRHNVLLVHVNLVAPNVPSARRTRFYEDVLQRLRALPGVRFAAGSMLTPIEGFFWNDSLYPLGAPQKNDDEQLVYFNSISPRYFATLGIPLLLGRDFTDRDDLKAPRAMIISQSTARKLFGSANPLGRMVVLSNTSEPGGKPYQVIGVVKDIKYGSIDEQPLRTAYVPTAQDNHPRDSMAFELRSGVPLPALTAAVRSALSDLRGDLSMEFRSLETQVDESLLQPRIVALLSSFFGALGLLLAMIGLYGVMSYAVVRRRGEIGIRMALGAQRSSVVWLVLRDVMLILAAGIAVGVFGSIAASHFVTRLLYGLKAADPRTIAGAAALLAVAMLAAAYWPARRASGLDPMAALREE